MARKRMDIQTVVVGGGPVASLVVLAPRDGEGDGTMVLPIRIGTVEAMAISMGVEPAEGSRPMTHDLMRTVIDRLGAKLDDVDINDVSGTTFFAQLELTASDGSRVCVDSRPSDAIALAVRSGAPIYAEDDVLDTAALPDFKAVEADERKQELAEFHDFVEGLSPEDFDK